MSTKSTNNNNNDNEISRFEKGNYVSFNSKNPFTFKKYTFKQNKNISLKKGIVEEFGNGTVLISYRNRLINLKLHFRRNVDQVTLVSKIYLYFWYSEEPRLP